jgi:hypothetical protein
MPEGSNRLTLRKVQYIRCTSKLRLCRPIIRARHYSPSSFLKVGLARLLSGAKQAYVRQLYESKPSSCLRAGEAPGGLAGWIEAHGGLVVYHELSFRDDLLRLAEDPKWAYTLGLWGSYLRVDIPAIMQKVGGRCLCAQWHAFNLCQSLCPSSGTPAFCPALERPPLHSTRSQMKVDVTMENAMTGVTPVCDRQFQEGPACDWMPMSVCLPGAGPSAGGPLCRGAGLRSLDRPGRGFLARLGLLCPAKATHPQHWPRL